MFEKFLQAHEITSRQSTPQTDTSHLPPYLSQDAVNFLKEHQGSTFHHGLYRLHLIQDMPNWSDTVKKVFPELGKDVLIFGYDWMGSQFGIVNREGGKTQEIVLADLGGAEAMTLPDTFEHLHDGQFVSSADEALRAEMFQDWMKIHRRAINPDECVTYKHPLFLGGEDEIENLEVNDMEVNWEIIGQLIIQTRDLPPGTPVGNISFS